MGVRKDAVVAAKVDVESKERAGEVFGGLGLTTGAAVSMFISACARTGRLAISDDAVCGSCSVWAAFANPERGLADVVGLSTPERVSREIARHAPEEGWGCGLFYGKDAAMSWADDMVGQGSFPWLSASERRARAARTEDGMRAAKDGSDGIAQDRR